MNYHTPTHHQDQTGNGEELSGIKKCPHIHKRAVAAAQCRLCRSKTAKSGADLDITLDGSDEFYPAEEMNPISDDEEFFSAHEAQPTSQGEESLAYWDLGLEQLDLSGSNHNGSKEHYNTSNNLLDPGDGSDNTPGYSLGNECTWNRFSRGVSRQLMPPNIPRTKITGDEGVEKECPLVPELKLTTPEGEECWLDDLTYYGVQGGWADSDDDDDESIYN